MLTIKSYIDESLFTGHDSDSLAKKVGDAIEKEAIEKFEKCCYSKKNSSNDYQIHLGPKGYEITVNKGSIVIFNADKKSLDYKISKFQGTLTVNSCESKDLTWLFTDDCDFDGNLIVEWNDYLTSLKGCPESVDVFKCIYNPELKSLAGAPKQCKMFVWYDNGDEIKPAKKIQIEDIKKYLKTKNADILTSF
jgi:hypothetical protein